MILPAASPEIPNTNPARTPRLNSLEHRLQHAKDANREPIELIDELLFLLDDPPAGTVDRWQAGADLCASHGIETSRIAVWRYFRSHIIQWRRDQNPPPPAAALDPQELERLHDQARGLAAQRLVDLLGDPNLSPGLLVALIQNQNVREKISLSRAQFADRVSDRDRERHRAKMQGLFEDAGRRAIIPKELEEIYSLAKRLDLVSLRSTSLREVPATPPAKS